MSGSVQEGVFILLKMIKKEEQKWPHGRTELPKLKTNIPCEACNTITKTIMSLMLQGRPPATILYL